MDEKPRPRHKRFLIFLLVLVPALLLLAWSQASFNLKFIHPSSPEATILLLVVSAFIFLAFVIFALILARILLKVYVERRQQQLGSRFKTKMVVAFLALSLVPVCFLFAFAYGLLNRSIDKWFGVPFDIVRRDANEIVRQLETEVQQAALHSAGSLAESDELGRALELKGRPGVEAWLSRRVADLDLVSALCFDASGRMVGRAGAAEPAPREVTRLFPQVALGLAPTGGNPARLQSGNSEWLVSARQVKRGGKPVGVLVSVTRSPVQLRRMAEEIQRESQKYDLLSQERKGVKRIYLSMLWLVTLLILFVATWLALFISKQVTVPIQALAEATHEVSKGNLGYQVAARAGDELGTLVRSFNDMTRQLQENRRAIEQAAKELHQANRELEERGNTMAAILKNIPTGVISFDSTGQVTQVNSTLERMLGREKAAPARSLADLFTAEDARDISRLFRRAGRQGVVARQMELDLGARRAVVTLTLSSIRAGNRTVGSVLVLEDLTEFLRAQKAVAWREVAQRIAHEIKNPLTPIQLSTERIQRLVSRSGSAPPSPELMAAITESAALIDREVATLKSLVDEFSSFARFPASQPSPSSLNAIIENALNVFDGRLNDIQVHRELAPDLPLIQADPEQMKRAVVNLIDNAAEAVENSVPKEIWVRTALDPEREVVELVVADSGPGIPPDAVERLFLPYFSTKRRGTGLGLAIVSRIVSEHNGSIRVEENRPAGAKFIIELPIERTALNVE